MRQRSADAHLVPVFLENAQGFLRAGSEGPEPEAWAPRAQMLCCAIELALKAALIANGWTDDQNRREIRHDLMRGLKAATGAGLKVRNDRTQAVVAALSPRYARHELDDMAKDAGRPPLADCAAVARDLLDDCRAFAAVADA